MCSPSPWSPINVKKSYLHLCLYVCICVINTSLFDSVSTFPSDQRSSFRSQQVCLYLQIPYIPCHHHILSPPDNQKDQTPVWARARCFCRSLTFVHTLFNRSLTYTRYTNNAQGESAVRVLEPGRCEHSLILDDICGCAQSRTSSIF